MPALQSIQQKFELINSFKSPFPEYINNFEKIVHQIEFFQPYKSFKSIYLFQEKIESIFHHDKLISKLTYNLFGSEVGKYIYEYPLSQEEWDSALDKIEDCEDTKIITPLEKSILKEIQDAPYENRSLIAKYLCCFIFLLLMITTMQAIKNNNVHPFIKEEFLDLGILVSGLAASRANQLSNCIYPQDLNQPWASFAETRSRAFPTPAKRSS